MTSIDVRQVCYRDSSDADALIQLLDAYALDPMGGGEPLSDFTRENLTAALVDNPAAYSVIAYVDDVPAGLVNCFTGFSTFKCKPLVNIHDVVVLEQFRGRGLTRKMFDLVAQIASTKGACKLTLEVLEGNQVARQAYASYGFKGYELDPKMGKAEFWELTL